jgi:hypothetical protein
MIAGRHPTNMHLRLLRSTSIWLLQSNSENVSSHRSRLNRARGYIRPSPPSTHLTSLKVVRCPRSRRGARFRRGIQFRCHARPYRQSIHGGMPNAQGLRDCGLAGRSVLLPCQVYGRRDGDAATNQALGSRLRLLCRCRMSWGNANTKLASRFEKDTFLVCPGVGKIKVWEPLISGIAEA